MSFQGFEHHGEVGRQQHEISWSNLTLEYAPRADPNDCGCARRKNESRQSLRSSLDNYQPQVGLKARPGLEPEAFALKLFAPIRLNGTNADERFFDPRTHFALKFMDTCALFRHRLIQSPN